MKKSTNEELPEFIKTPNPNIYTSKNYLVLDFETTNIDKGDPYNPSNKIILASWKFNGQIKTVVGSEFEQKELIADIEKADFIIAHNAIFECAWLQRCGWSPTQNPVYCTQVAEYVIAGNRKLALSLEECSKRRGHSGKTSTVNKLIKIGVSPEDIPKRWLTKYCENDVIITEKLFLDQINTLIKDDLLPVTYARCLVTPVLADIQKHGMMLDEDRVLQKFTTCSEQLKNLQAEFKEFAGDVNIASGKQVAKFLFETLGFEIPKNHKGEELRTASGAIKTDAEAHELLKAVTPEQKKYKKIKKEISAVKNVVEKYLEKMYECCTKDSGIIKARFNQTITATHRLSSTGGKYKIQFQNIQRDLKKLFKARNEGWLIAEADESQLEYRVAVDLAKDEAGTYDILNKVDVHALTAETLFPKSWPLYINDPTNPKRKALRTAAKASTFKPLYGGSSGTDLEKKYYKKFKEKHKQITEMQQNWIDEVIKTKKLRIASGLIFYWPEARRSSSGYASNTASTSNFPIQSFATADIVPLALVLLWHKIKANNLLTFIVNTVHDSIIAEMPPEEKEQYEKLAQEALTEDVVKMIKQLYNYDITIPLEAEIQIGTHWGE